MLYTILPWAIPSPRSPRGSPRGCRLFFGLCRIFFAFSLATPSPTCLWAGAHVWDKERKLHVAYTNDEHCAPMFKRDMNQAHVWGSSELLPGSPAASGRRRSRRRLRCLLPRGDKDKVLLRTTPYSGGARFFFGPLHNPGKKPLFDEPALVVSDRIVTPGADRFVRLLYSRCFATSYPCSRSMQHACSRSMLSILGRDPSEGPYRRSF